jgi:hypothetical protein
MLYFITK